MHSMPAATLSPNGKDVEMSIIVRSKDKKWDKVFKNGSSKIWKIAFKKFEEVWSA